MYNDFKKEPKEHKKYDTRKRHISSKLHMICGDRNANNMAGSGRMSKDFLLFKLHTLKA
jgi:hypothetical protein